MPSWISRRPQTLADVLPVITAEAANFSDVRIRLRNRFVKRRRDADHICNAMPGRHESIVAGARDFVPPHIAIERRGNCHRQMRAAELDVGITVTSERDGTAEVSSLDKLKLQLLVLRRPQQHL